MLPHVHRSFIVSAERLQRVARVEYVWMSLWLQSWQEVARDRLFDNLAARVWPLLLGCPHMAHFGEQAGFHGCVGGMEQRPGPRHGALAARLAFLRGQSCTEGPESSINRRS